MSYYNCFGIRPKHGNISKRVEEGVITICLVLDQSTVIFQNETEHETGSGTCKYPVSVRKNWLLEKLLQIR
jgi:hypothetical protein